MDTSNEDKQQPIAISTWNQDNTNIPRHFLGGAIGGMTATFITSPLEIVKTRLQIEGSRSAFSAGRHSITTYGVMNSIVKQEGVFGLWRGVTPALLGIVPARALYFGTYSFAKHCFARYEKQGLLYDFLAASGAGGLSATLVCPLWVVKTRVQLLPAHPELAGAQLNKLTTQLAYSSGGVMNGGHIRQFKGFKYVAREMYQKEGLLSFYKGLTASYWGISESALQFVLYEQCKEFMEEPTPFKYFLAAGFCKLIASATTYPHEVVRTRMRDQRTPIGSDFKKYRSMLQSIETIYREEGIRGLYGGMPTHLMRVVPNAAIMFLVVEMLANQK